MLWSDKKSLIYLTGFMGSGKTTIGGFLAEQLGYQFFDLDQLIEARLAKSIERVFQEDGANFFRVVESEVLKEVKNLQFAVIALGGGTILHETNLAMVQNSGYLIWLYAEPKDVWSRVSETNRRVLLEGRRDSGTTLKEEDIFHRIHFLMEVREPYYQYADCRIDTTGKTIEKIVEEILLELEKIRIT